MPTADSTTLTYEQLSTAGLEELQVTRSECTAHLKEDRRHSVPWEHGPGTAVKFWGVWWAGRHK